MYLLDTNIVSMLDARRHAHAPELIAWLERNGASLFLSVMTITEMDAGILKPRRNGKLERAVDLAALLAAILQDFSDRILEVDIEIAHRVAQLGASTYRQPVVLPDLIIAATAARHGLIVLTRNLRDFGRLGVPMRNPVVDPPPDI